MIALLDTNAYTALARGEARLIERLSEASQILMPALVLGGLEYGFRHGNQYEANRRQLDAFLTETYVDFLTISRDTTLQYGLVMTELRAAGCKIPTNDAWIAAHAGGTMPPCGRGTAISAMSPPCPCASGDTPGKAARTAATDSPA